MYFMPSPFYFDYSSSSENTESGSNRFIGGPRLPNPSLVPQVNADADQLSVADTNKKAAASSALQPNKGSSI